MRVSRSRYYHWIKSPRTEREKENERLMTKFKVLFEKGRGSYGIRRFWGSP